MIYKLDNSLLFLLIFGMNLQLIGVERDDDDEDGDGDGDDDEFGGACPSS